MIVVDFSAVVAILEEEADRLLYAHVIQDADDLTVSAVKARKCAVVLRRRRGPEGERISGSSWPITAFRSLPSMRST